MRFGTMSIDAIFFARGGYGAMRHLDGIDYAAIARDPKPVVGLQRPHRAYTRPSLRRPASASFHGPMLNTDFFDGLSPRS